MGPSGSSASSSSGASSSPTTSTPPPSESLSDPSSCACATNWPRTRNAQMRTGQRLCLSRLSPFNGIESEPEVEVEECVDPGLALGKRVDGLFGPNLCLAPLTQMEPA